MASDLAPVSESARSWLRRVMSSAWVQRWGRELLILVVLVGVLAAPWLLRPQETTAPLHYQRKLVILTPHHQKIRHEFGLAFARNWKERTGETLYVDWRAAATGEIAMMLRSEYTAAYQYYWEHKLHRDWQAAVGAGFLDAKLKPEEFKEGELSEAQRARRDFLDSNVGIGADLFFGGGSFDFAQQANAGILVAADPSGRFGVGPLMAKHPQWFTPEVIPQKVSGEPFYDPEKRWVGCCVSAMGMVYNKDVLKRLGIEKPLAQWTDLANPKLVGQVAMSDPNKSGSVTKTLEQLIQQQMNQAIQELKSRSDHPYKTEEELVRAGVAIGWERGLRLIQQISANSRYFTDHASKIPLEVAQGDAAAGTAIDFYGRSFEDQVAGADGTSRVGYVTPLGGSTVGVDPVGLLRGAPEPEVAMAFMEFVLSDEGQKLWNYRPGVAGGPERSALRRLPIRRDFYTQSHQQWMTDPEIDPYEEAKAFEYHREWTEPLFSVIRFLVKVMCIDVHDEQQKAWRAMADTQFTPEAVKAFGDLRLVNYQAALKLAADLRRKDKVLETRLARELTSVFRGQYEKAYQLARDGR